MGGSKKTWEGGRRSFLNLISRRIKINEGGIGLSKYPLISVTNEIKRHKCLILMLNLKVSKQTKSKANMNKVIIKSIKHIKLSKFSIK